jgi:hypothetical protein
MRHLLTAAVLALSITAAQAETAKDFAIASAVAVSITYNDKCAPLPRDFSDNILKMAGMVDASIVKDIMGRLLASRETVGHDVFCAKGKEAIQAMMDNTTRRLKEEAERKR